MSCLLLSGLSDRELLGRLKSLVEKERSTTLEILVHLNEVERRRLYLSLGYPSLFEYCTRHLGCSSSAAGRRIHVARCIRDYPEVYGLLEKNEVRLSSVCLVGSILTPDNKGDLLFRIRNKSEKEIEGIVADYRPPVTFRDRVRPVCVAIPVSPGTTTAASAPEGPVHSRTGSEKSPNVAAGSVAAGGTGGPPGASTETQPCVTSLHNTSVSPPTNHGVRLERKLFIQFLASEAFMKKFDEARALLSNARGKTSYEAVLEAALDAFLDEHSPPRKKERREKRKESRNTTGRKIVITANRSQPRVPNPHGAHETTRRLESPENVDRSRHIPARVRDAVFTRDNGRCTYLGKAGALCGTTRGLQIDHIVPYARGGTHTVSNLRLLCSKHNRLEAERVYVANAIRTYRPRE